MAEYIDEGTVESVMGEIGVDTVGIRYMLDKSRFRLILVRNVRNAIANIMKQEMLSIGGDAAVNKGCINCTVEKSDVLVMGTMRQIKSLISKMKSQVSESSKIADEMEMLINKK